MRPEPSQPPVPINPGPVTLEVVQGAVSTEVSSLSRVGW